MDAFLKQSGTFRDNQQVATCAMDSGDLERVSLMIQSFNRYNVDGLSLFLSVPEADICEFKQFESKTIHIIPDEVYAGKYFTNKKLHNLPVGYVNQEICKLAFWESEIAKNYLCVD